MVHTYPTLPSPLGSDRLLRLCCWLVVFFFLGEGERCAPFFLATGRCRVACGAVEAASGSGSVGLRPWVSIFVRRAREGTGARNDVLEIL
jgi:hypothetical protein